MGLPPILDVITIYMKCVPNLYLFHHFSCQCFVSVDIKHADEHCVSCLLVEGFIGDISCLVQDESNAGIAPCVPLYLH